MNLDSTGGVYFKNSIRGLTNKGKFRKNNGVGLTKWSNRSEEKSDGKSHPSWCLKLLFRAWSSNSSPVRLDDFLSP